MKTYTFTIGTSDGEYPAGTRIIDSILSRPVGIIVCGTQSYNRDFTQGNNTINFGNVLTTSNGDKVTVIFAE